MDVNDEYRGYRIISGSSDQLAIMYGSEVVEFVDNMSEAMSTIDAWMVAK